jgi:hypothetical protein
VDYGLAPATDSEFGFASHFLDTLSPGPPAWDRYTNDLKALMDPESARKWRFNASHVTRWGAFIILNYHAITFSISGTVSGSSGGTVNISAYRTDTGEKVGATSRTGNGSYTVTVYDNTLTYFTEARESAALLGRSDDGTPT